MPSAPLPPNALLQSYRSQGDYTDCYCMEVDGTAQFSDYVAAFYTSPLFKLERFVLTWAVNKPSSDEEAAQLASTKSTEFAAWTVEARTENQLLMCMVMSQCVV